MEPTPPTDVVIVCHDGSRVPVELVYAGRRRLRLHWQHQWRVTARVRKRDFKTLSVGTLPGHTDLLIELPD